MRGYSHTVEFERRESPGLRAITDSLSLQCAPVLRTSTACKSGMGLLELASGRDDVETTEPIRDDAMKIGALARWQERRAKELLAANVTGNITLADLAKACELSIRHFTRAFRGSTGMSPHAWLLHLRIERAKGLLTNSRRVLADIALDCGFADQSHFTRTFQRSVGVSPGAWQRLHRR